MQRVLVTGAAGYVGRNTVRALRARGLAVRGLVRSAASRAVVEAAGGEAAEGDLLAPASLEAACADVEAIVHAAAATDHGNGAAGAADAQAQVNVGGTQALLDAARKAGVRRIVHVSSEAVLATGRPLRNVDENTPIPARLAGPYSRTKAAAEQVVRTAAGLEAIVVRPRLVWGRDDTTFLPALEEAARTGKLQWIGGGRYLTSTSHIANVAEGLCLALERGAAGAVYFIADAEPVEFRGFVERLLTARGVTPPRRSVPRPLVATAVAGGGWLESLTGGRLRAPLSRQEYASLGMEVTVSWARAARELGYKPIVSVEEGLRELAARAA